jgi:hypothetical protein
MANLMKRSQEEIVGSLVVVVAQGVGGNSSKGEARVPTIEPGFEGAKGDLMVGPPGRRKRPHPAPPQPPPLHGWW